MELKESKKHFYPLTSSHIVMCILAVMFILFGALFGSESFVLGVLMSQYGILFLPIVLWGLLKKVDLKKAFRLKKIPGHIALKVVGLSLLMVPVIILANLVTFSLVNRFFTPIETPIPIATSREHLILYFFVIAITPAICEEFFFRGMMLNSCEGKMNFFSAAVYSSLFFALFHFNFQNLLGPFLLGMLYAYLVQITGSIALGFLGHLTNNGFAVLASYFLMSYAESGVNDQQLDQQVSLGQWLVVFIFLSFIVLFSIKGVKALLKRVEEHYGDENSPRSIWEDKKIHYSPTIVFSLGFMLLLYAIIFYLMYF